MNKKNLPTCIHAMINHRDYLGHIVTGPTASGVFVLRCWSPILTRQANLTCQSLVVSPGRPVITWYKNYDLHPVLVKMAGFRKKKFQRPRLRLFCANLQLCHARIHSYSCRKNIDWLNVGCFEKHSFCSHSVALDLSNIGSNLMCFYVRPSKESHVSHKIVRQLEEEWKYFLIPGI